MNLKLKKGVRSAVVKQLASFGMILSNSPLSNLHVRSLLENLLGLDFRFNSPPELIISLQLSVRTYVCHFLLVVGEQPC